MKKKKIFISILIIFITVCILVTGVYSFFARSIIKDTKREMLRNNECLADSKISINYNDKKINGNMGNLLIITYMEVYFDESIYYGDVDAKNEFMMVTFDNSCKWTIYLKDGDNDSLIIVVERKNFPDKTHIFTLRETMRDKFDAENFLLSEFYERTEKEMFKPN